MARHLDGQRARQVAGQGPPDGRIDLRGARIVRCGRTDVQVGDAGAGPVRVAAVGRRERLPGVVDPDDDPVPVQQRDLDSDVAEIPTTEDEDAAAEGDTDAEADSSEGAPAEGQSDQS